MSFNVIPAKAGIQVRLCGGKRIELPQAFLHKPYSMTELKAALGAAMAASADTGTPA
jgi:hypothetical protein